MPCHDKKSPNFVIPAEYTEEQLRIVNRRADDEATNQLRTMLEDTPILQWRRKHKKLSEWSHQAIRWATARCRYFHNYVARKEGIVDPVDLDNGTQEDGPSCPERFLSWARTAETLFPVPASALGKVDFTHAIPLPQDEELMLRNRMKPLPGGGLTVRLIRITTLPVTRPRCRIMFP